MSCCNSKTVIWVLATLFLGLVLILVINFILTPVQLQGIQAELTDLGGGQIADGGNVVFNTVLNDQTDNITYDATTGEFTITEPGNYNVAWWTAPDGAGPAVFVGFAVAVDGVPYSEAYSPIVSVQLAADALVTVDTVPTVITIENVTGDAVFVPDIPVQAGIVIEHLPS